MKVLITGATGMVGSEVLREAVSDNSINEIIALSRKAPVIIQPKIKTIIHTDFLDYSRVNHVFKDVSACIWCMGVSQLQVNKEQYIIVTYDYTLAAAKAMLAQNPLIKFVFVSGDGADPSGMSRTLFARIKGQTEKALAELPFRDLIIARPAGIKPVRKNSRAPFLYKLFYFFYPLFKLLTPGKVITSEELAKSLLNAAKHKKGKIILENKELKKIT